MNILEVFKRERKKMLERGWDKIYILVDLHGTVFEPTYSKEDEHYRWYRWAKEALQLMSKCPWMSLILWTSSWPKSIEGYRAEMKKWGIEFDMVGINTQEPNNELSCFNQKTYFNIGLDDKFGFDPLYDWGDILAWLEMNGIGRDVRS